MNIKGGVVYPVAVKLLARKVPGVLFGDCAGCRIRRSCTATWIRTVVRQLDEAARDCTRELAATPMLVAMARQRRKVETLFAHLKQQFELRRLKLRG